MNFERLEWMEDEVLDKMLEQSRDDRIHPTLTDLIYCLTKTWYKVNLPDVKPNRRQKLFYVLGLGLEKTLLVKPEGAILSGEKDGIPYHLDSFDADELIEMKTTRARVSDEEPFITEGWDKQIKGYLYAEGLTEVNLVTLHVIQPEIRVWRLSFTQGELDENWNWLLSRKATWDMYKEADQMPAPFNYNMDWECRDCEFLTFCEAWQKGKKIVDGY